MGIATTLQKVTEISMGLCFMRIVTKEPIACSRLLGVTTLTGSGSCTWSLSCGQGV